MADELLPKIPIDDAKADNFDVNPVLLDAVDTDSFEDIAVPGDGNYVDPDMADPAAELVVDITTTDSTYLPVPSIDLTSVTKTRKVLSTGEVVYDIRFNVTDVGADSYEVAYVKQ